ncbi:MAG: hypothetical protein EOO68_05660 [Moraxellaceae bacterium]|nr:MAG: hypothetical protein EOO68_05660 [Moraxellaceae bacterium]
MQIRHISKFLVAGLLSAASSLTLAADEVYNGWSWAAHVDHINISDDVANRPDVLVGDTATALGVAAEYFTGGNNMTYSVGLNYIFYNDNNEFSQYIDDYWSGYGYEESDAGGFMAYVEVGPEYHFGADGLSFFTVRGGYSGIFSSERSISNCDNCYSEDINIDGGAYGVLGVGRSLGYLNVGVQFQQYFSGDLNNAIRLTLSGSF